MLIRECQNFVQETPRRQLLERCVRAIVSHHLVNQLRRLGYVDGGVQLLIEEILNTISLEEIEQGIRDGDLLERLLTDAKEVRCHTSRSRLTQHGPHANGGYGAQMGISVATAMLAEVVQEARAAAVATMAAVGIPAGLAGEMVEQATATMQEPVEAVIAQEQSVSDLVSRFKNDLTNMTAVSALVYAAFFLKGRFIPQWDIISDILVIIDLCRTEPEGGVPWIDANGSFSKCRMMALGMSIWSL